MAHAYGYWTRQAFRTARERAYQAERDFEDGLATRQEWLEAERAYGRAARALQTVIRQQRQEVQG